MVEVTDRLLKKLSTVQRAKIVEHVPGPVPIIRTEPHKIKDYLIVEALRRLDLVAMIPKRSNFPTHSELTAAGREAAAKILADCADMLVAAGALDESIFAERPLAVLRRLKRDGGLLPHEAGEVAEAEELDEVGKLAL